MNWWNAVSTCWPPGVGGCVAWWDAWSVLVAIIAALIASAGLIVTGASAVAVFWLGKQANSIANSAHEIDAASRNREGQFILVYLYSEILDAHSSVEAWLVHIQKVRQIFLLLGQEQRKDVLQIIYDVHMPKAEEIFNRLHVLEPAVGKRLARVLGTVRLLKLAQGPVLRLKNDAEGRERLDKMIGNIEELAKDMRVVYQAATVAIRPIEGA